MPYVPQDEDKEKEQTAEGGQPPAEIGQGPTSATPTKSGFVNVDEYLSKNPNEGENLTNRVISNLESQKGEAQSAVTDAGNQFGSLVDSGSVKNDADFLGRAFSSPETFVGNNDDVARFMAMRDAAYSGPKSLQETDLFAPAQSKVDKLKVTGESIGTEAGRNALLNPLSPKPTAGKTALNQLIMQGTPNAAKRLEDTGKSFPAVEQQWQGIIAQGNQRATAGQQETEATKTATRAGLQSSQDAFKAALQDKVGKATSERDAFNTQYNTLRKSLADEKGLSLRPEDIKALGLSDDAYQYLAKLNQMNMQMGDFGTPVSTGNYILGGRAASNIPTAPTVAGSEDYAREAALQRLSGMDLGLPDLQEPGYRMDGKLPGFDLTGAFKAGGDTLQAADRADLTAHDVNMDRSIAEGTLYGWVPRDGYDPSQDLFKSAEAVKRLHDPSYYTTPSTNAAPLPDIPMAPPPAGWDPNQPAPYPRPTSEQPSNLINAQWNPYTGQWEGVQLQPINPPPSGGGGGFHTF